jgi:hypothetical protein
MKLGGFRLREATSLPVWGQPDAGPLAPLDQPPAEAGLTLDFLSP